MNLWDIDIKNYLQELKDDETVTKIFPCEFTGLRFKRLIDLYNEYAKKALIIVNDPNPVDNFLDRVKEILDLDARLYFLIIEMLVTTEERTYEEIIDEFEKFYKTEYVDFDMKLPFTSLRLIW